MKTWAPMMSVQAWGKVRIPYSLNYFFYPYGFQSYAVFQRRRTWHGMITVLQKYPEGVVRHSANQQPLREKFAAGVYAWQHLPQAEQYAYDALKFPTKMSGYNRFLRHYMKS